VSAETEPDRVCEARLGASSAQAREFCVSLATQCCGQGAKGTIRKQFWKGTDAASDIRTCAFPRHLSSGPAYGDVDLLSEFTSRVDCGETVGSSFTKTQSCVSTRRSSRPRCNSDSLSTHSSRPYVPGTFPATVLSMCARAAVGSGRFEVRSMLVASHKRSGEWGGSC